MHDDNHDLYKQIVENSEEGIWIIDEQGVTTFVNDKTAAMFGYSVEEMLGKDIFYFMFQDEVELARVKMKRRKSGIKEVHDFVFRTKTGKKVWTCIAASPIHDKNGKFIGALGMVNNISARRRSEIFLEAQSKVFNLLVLGAPVNEVLMEVTNAIEYLIDDVMVSILLLDEEGKRLWTGAAPGLPQEYNEAINGAPIGAKVGSCGTSAFEKKQIIVTDIQTDPLWEDYLELANKHNLRSCWSSPIFSKDKKVLGTFAVYSHNVRAPHEFELQLIKDATAASALSIEHLRILENLKKTRDNATFLSEARMELSSSLDAEKVLMKIPELIVSHFADWCLLCQFDQHGNLVTTAAAAIDSKRKLIGQLHNYKPDLEAPEGLPRSIRTRESFLYQELNPEQLQPGVDGWPDVGTKDPKILKIMSELGMKSYIAVPILIRGKAVGGLLIASSGIHRLYKNEDLKLANELARSCASAIDNTNLYRESQQAIAAREVVISVASHEFRTPLTILRGRIDLLAMILPLKPSAHSE
ncbi:MAG: PAS domain S-box protein [Bdellovibrionales bacterium]|nr:PAS domain S-box protein [Bdellovibrionales bacterium]